MHLAKHTINILYPHGATFFSSLAEVSEGHVYMMQCDHIYLYDLWGFCGMTQSRIESVQFLLAIFGSSISKSLTAGHWPL